MLANETGLAALAVALETCPHEYAEQYLHDLAKLRLAEVGTAIRVARECLRERYLRPRTETRSFAYPVRPGRVTVGFVVTRYGTGRTGYGTAKVVRFDAAGSC